MARSFSVVSLALTIQYIAAAPFPNGVIPALEQIVCHVAENETLKNFAVHDICGEVSKVYPSGNATCEADLTKAWESFAEQCKDMDHLADWVQKEFCSVSGNAALEAEVVAVSCGLMQHLVPGIPSMICTKAMQKTWSLLASECPKTVAFTPEVAPVRDIEKLICGVMENKTIEHQASQQICQYATKVVPSTNTTVCVEKVEGLWESFVSECKEIAGVAILIKNAFCHNANNTMMENEFVAVGCGLAQHVAPKVPGTVCKTALQEAWSALASECPSEVAQPSIIV